MPAILGTHKGKEWYVGSVREKATSIAGYYGVRRNLHPQWMNDVGPFPWVVWLTGWCLSGWWVVGGGLRPFALLRPT